jgi:2-oxoglutarate ferredoxin oxidoreductase subunit beta
MGGEGFTMVEVLSQCPTNWGMDPVAAVEWLEREMVPVFPLGEIKNTLEALKPASAAARVPVLEAVS